MTKRECVEQLGLANETYDGALPENWVDDVVRFTGCDYHSITGQFVWVYDGDYRIMGRPLPLTTDANKILAHYNQVRGSSWPLTPNAINLEDLTVICDYLD